jgi:hypothetical protein
LLTLTFHALTVAEYSSSQTTNTALLTVFAFTHVADVSTALNTKFFSFNQAVLFVLILNETASIPSAHLAKDLSPNFTFVTVPSEAEPFIVNQLAGIDISATAVSFSFSTIPMLDKLIWNHSLFTHVFSTSAYTYIVKFFPIFCSSVNEQTIGLTVVHVPSTNPAEAEPYLTFTESKYLSGFFDHQFLANDKENPVIDKSLLLLFETVNDPKNTFVLFATNVVVEGFVLSIVTLPAFAEKLSNVTTVGVAIGRIVTGALYATAVAERSIDSSNAKLKFHFPAHHITSPFTTNVFVFLSFSRTYGVSKLNVKYFPFIVQLANVSPSNVNSKFSK